MALPYVVVIYSKFAIFAVEMTTDKQNMQDIIRCDLLKIRYLCGRNDNCRLFSNRREIVVICSKFAIFAVEMTTSINSLIHHISCDLLKIRYLCGRNDN